jgi:V/A-type H+-transporting ATPase subunit D
MDRLPLPPTKSNLLKVKEQLATAREGYELLEQKREILVMELMALLDEVKFLEREIDARTATAYPALRGLLFQVGRTRADEISSSVGYDFALREKPVRLAGIDFTTLELAEPELSPQYPLEGSRAECDRTMAEFLALLKLLSRLAAIRTMVWRLALEVKKTQRRVNALEKMVIPQALATRTTIENVLEERDRDAFFARKLLKSRRGGPG